jgi:hypothetical protein
MLLSLFVLLRTGVAQAVVGQYFLQFPGPGWSIVIGGRSPEGKGANQAFWGSMFCSLSIEDTQHSLVQKKKQLDRDRGIFLAYLSPLNRNRLTRHELVCTYCHPHNIPPVRH